MSAPAARPRDPLRVTEKAFQQAVITYARLRGWMVFHPFDSRRSEPGWPDVVLVRGNRALFRELKREGGRVTPEQRAWLDALTEAGLDARVWYPSSWAAIEKELV